MTHGRRLLVSAVVLPLLLAAAREALAEPDPRKAEAAQRFDRALVLFEDGDNEGALAEFRRTYELFPNPVVLYNIGLVYAAMKRPVDAVDALEKAMSGDGLSAEQRARASETILDQKSRIGRLQVTTVPEGARVEVDNVEVAKTPLAAPLRVSAGSHIVGAVAEGYAPARKEVVVAGNADASLHLELVSSQGKQLGNLAVKTKIPGVEVRVDGEVIGKTPLSTTVALVAGRHTVELRRPGYVSQKKNLELGAGATGELSFDLVVDEVSLATEGATLALDVSEPGSVVFVDDEHRGPYTGPLRLPRGPHRIRVEQGGFFPVAREVTLEPGSPRTVRVELEPTPEKRADYEGTARFHRTWGWIGIIGGAVLAGGGGAWLAINAGPKDDARKDFDAVLDASRSGTDFQKFPGHDCDIAAGGSAEQCNSLIDEYERAYDDAKAKDIPGFIGIGVGGAVLATGVVLLLTGDDPDRYERKPSGSLLSASRKPRIHFAGGPGDVGGGVRVTF